MSLKRPRESSGEEPFDPKNGVREEEWESENDRGTISASSDTKRVKEMCVDRLSALPDSLLITILSKLEMNEAATTAVLSRRWQFLWIELPNLDFWESGEIRDFVSWVHRTLLLRKGIYLNEFRVFFWYHDSFASDVNAWVHFAVKNRVKKLSLVFSSHHDSYTLPQVIFSHECLTYLRLERCNVVPQRTIEWQSLTDLQIEHVELPDHVIRKIMCGCPVLYRLCLADCWGFNRLEVDSQSIGSLGISVRRDKSSEHLIEISAPYICMLHMAWETNMRLGNIQSVVYADIDYDGWYYSEEVMSNTVEVLERIKHVEELVLGAGLIEVISRMVVHGWRLPQSSQDCLVIDTLRDEDSIPAILGLLESSTKLDTLVIQCCGDPYEGSVRTWGPVARDDLDGELLQLKTVRFLGYASPYLGGEPMLTVARILLKRATALEKMVIDGHEDLTPSDVSNMAQTVFSYQKSSQKAVVLVHE